MPDLDWTCCPDDLGVFDASVVRCIAGELNEAVMLRATRSAGVDAWRRMAGLVAKHSRMTVAEVQSLAPADRRRIANDIVAAELQEADTMPGQLVPLRSREFG